MKDRQPRAAIKWNLMLLVGRPIAFIGCFQFIRSTVAPPETRAAIFGFGVLLIAVGFVVGWTGKIGKFFFTSNRFEIDRFF